MRYYIIGMNSMLQGKEVKPISTEDMIDLEAVVKTKNQEFIDKHPELSVEDRKNIVKESEAAKKKYSTDLSSVEQNLMGFFEKTTDIIDPDTGNVIAKMRQLPYWEMMEMIPEPLIDSKLTKEEKAELIKNDDDIQMMTFIMMDRMLVEPQHDVVWWRDNATPEFIAVFSGALENLFKKLEDDVNFFPEQ